MSINYLELKFGSLKEAFEYAIPNYEVTRDMYHRVVHIDEAYVSKNEAHLRFYGGHLMGTERITFTNADVDALFSYVIKGANALNIENVLRRAVREEKDKHGKMLEIPLINPDFKVVSNVFNLTTVYLVHLTEISKHLSPQEKQDCKKRLYAYMFYRFLSSILFGGRFFSTFLADPEIAEAAYQSLSNKYILKVVGNWRNLIYYLAEATIAEEGGSHHETIVQFRNQDAINRLMSDPETRLKGFVKNIYDAYKQIYDKRKKVHATSTITAIEDDTAIREIIVHPGVHIEYIKRIFPDRASLIKPELLQVVQETMPSINPNYLLTTLEWTSDNYFGLQRNDIIDGIDTVMEHGIRVVTRDTGLLKNFAALAGTLAGMYSSARSKDPTLLKARTVIEHLAKSATKTTNTTALASTRTGWMLYVVLRAFSMKHYS